MRHAWFIRASQLADVSVSTNTPLRPCAPTPAPGTGNRQKLLAFDASAGYA